MKNQNPNLNPVLLKDAVQTFIQGLASVYGASALDSTQLALDQLTATTGDVPIANVTAAHIRQALFQPQFGPRTRQKRLGVYKKFFRWVCKSGHLPAHQPTVADLFQIRVPVAPPQILMPAALAALLLAAGDPGIVLRLVFQAFGAIRSGELMRLAWSKITPGKSIFLGPEITGGLTRIVPILPVLDAWLAPFYGATGPIFSSPAMRPKFRRWACGQGHRFLSCDLRYSCLAYRVVQTGDRARIAAEAGLTVDTFNKLTGAHVISADAAAYFTLIPEVIGITDWPHVVAKLLAA